MNAKPAFQARRAGLRFIGALLLLGCVKQPEPPMVMSPPVRGVVLPADSAYFPAGVLPRWRVLYSRYLAAMGEPPLDRFADSADVAAVRLLWLRSFHVPMAVRLMKRGDHYALIGVALGPPVDDRPGAVTRRDSLPLDARVWQLLTKPLEKEEFWRADSTFGLDGAQWMIEHVSSDRYRADDWWTPSAEYGTEHIRSFGLALLRRTRFDLGPVY